MSQAAGQVNILIFLLKIKFSPCVPINFVMQGKCLFLDISRPASLRNGLINVFIICSNMMSCVKDSLYMANSVNNGQNALDGMV